MLTHKPLAGTADDAVMTMLLLSPVGLSVTDSVPSPCGTRAVAVTAAMVPDPSLPDAFAAVNPLAAAVMAAIACAADAARAVTVGVPVAGLSGVQVVTRSGLETSSVDSHLLSPGNSKTQMLPFHRALYCEPISVLPLAV